MAVDFDLTAKEKEFNEVVNMLNDYWESLAINIFEWKRESGKPLTELSEGLTSQQIEQWLYESGRAIFVNDKTLGYLCLQVQDSNKRNVYNKAINFKAIGLNYVKDYSIDNAVIIKNNCLAKATKDFVNYYVHKMADIELTKDLQRNAHKTPLVLETTEDTLLTAKNIFKKIRANEPVIFKNKTKGEGDVGVNVLNTNNTYINDKLEDDYHNYEARILTILGLDNYCEDKHERVQSAEVESQQEFIISSFRASLRERQQACEKINKMFGLDLYVDYVKADEIETGKDNENVSRETNEEGEDNE